MYEYKIENVWKETSYDTVDYNHHKQNRNIGVDTCNPNFLIGKSLTKQL